MSKKKPTVAELLERIEALEKKCKELEEAHKALSKAASGAISRSMVF